MFKVGDYVTNGAIEGTVKEIKMCAHPNCDFAGNETVFTLKEPSSSTFFEYQADLFTQVEYHIKHFTQVQRVWRHLLETPYYGFFLWEILEVVGESKKEPYFEDAADGGFIFRECYHTFKKERALELLNYPAESFQKVIII